MNRPRRLSIRLRLTLTYTLLILLTGASLLAVVFAVLAIVPGYAFTAGPFPYGRTGGDLYTVHDRADVLRLFVIVAVPALLVVGGIGGVVSWVVAGRLLRPLQDVVRTAELLDETNLDARITVSGAHDEIHDLGATINAMLDRLEASMTARGRFAASAAHELRTPLATIKTMAQVALRTATEPDTIRTLTRVATTADQMTAITNALLDLARGAPDTETHPVSLRTEVAAVVQAEAPALTAAGVAVRVALDEGVVLGSRALVRQLVANLVRNAIVHNHRDGWVVVTVDDSDGVQLTVENTGPVIPAAEVPRLVEPFHRMQRTRSAGSGHGLGLALVQSIATAHGAELTVAARDGGGLVVAVRFAAHDQGGDAST
ncbi:HAMP domain-containing sensor histidine kinase [Curtobacterium sp. VKM Ac-2922]|uniref:sensor histidine kinase n=1 Tax=Curtobacterium sp. VKM Ac-2922 TaxID=2929475 RepID=UPI001FB56D8A|nr:HAMP domain-containing sensor histidine kinase [Curtobacterium sp. VKM Ac-2922]MCJ1715820.1 HAMP domain-containing histidine kinase [Curtobacterium sp. VKM Ac-2922]